MTLKYKPNDTSTIVTRLIVIANERYIRQAYNFPINITKTLQWKIEIFPNQNERRKNHNIRNYDDVNCFEMKLPANK